MQDVGGQCIENLWTVWCLMDRSESQEMHISLSFWASLISLNIHASLTPTWPCLALGIHILVSVRVWKILMGWDHKIPLNNASQGLLTLSTISPCYTFASSCSDMCPTVYFSIYILPPFQIIRHFNNLGESNFYVWPNLYNRIITFII